MTPRLSVLAAIIMRQIAQMLHTKQIGQVRHELQLKDTRCTTLGTWGHSRCVIVTMHAIGPQLLEQRTGACKGQRRTSIFVSNNLPGLRAQTTSEALKHMVHPIDNHLFVFFGVARSQRRHMGRQLLRRGRHSFGFRLRLRNGIEV